MELHQQKYFRKILLKFGHYMPKGQRDGQDFTDVHYTSSAYLSVMQNTSYVDEPVTDEDKELMSQLPYASVLAIFKTPTPALGVT